MPSDAQNRDRTGEEIAGRYVIEAEIGRGGMGAVYAARDTRLGRRVALKTIASGAAAHTRQRLETEARAVASIEHPGIVTLFDVVEHGGETVLVMELVAGEPLRKILDERALTAEEAAHVVYEVSDALFAAHAKNLVHRDVKPDNVMMRADGRAALLDFGVAKIASEGTDPFAPTTTGEGVIVGTPAYLSPEQARGEPVSPATDQFSLAVTAYELLTRTLPWPTTTSMLMVAAIVSSPPKPSGLDPAVDEVLRRALDKDPAARFASVRDFASALGAALGVPNPSRPRSLMPISSTGRERAPSQPIAPSTPRPTPSALEIGKTLRATEQQLAVAAPRSPRRLAVAAVVVAAAVVAAGALTLRHRPTPTAPSVDAAPSALALADVPASGTTNAEALAKFREAMRSLALGLGNSAVFKLLDAAIAADPEFASAHLQRAFGSLRLSGGLDAAGRNAYRRALERKDRLDPRDADFLAALGPSFDDPPHWSESVTRLEAMLARRPGDAEVWEALGILRFKLSDIPAAVRAFEREQAADPKAYTSYFLRGHARADLGDLDGARKLFAECIDRIPATLECRAALAAMDRIAGDCAGADRVAREAASLAPDEPLVYGLRAESAASLGAPDEAIADLLAQKRAHMSEARRATEKSKDELSLSMRAGDFTSALAALDAVQRDAGEGARVEEIGKWAIARADLLREMGEAAKSGAVALAMLDRMTAHVLPEQPIEDPTGRLLAIANASGRLSDADYVARRDAWVAGWRTRLGERGWIDDGVNVWLGAYASSEAPTAARAREAFEALPKFGAYDFQHPDASTQELDPEIGALLLAAGRLDDAGARLGAATRWCRLVPAVRAFYLLGELRLRQSDVAGACDAWRAVERRWGHAKPRSVTLEAARAAMKQARCPAER